MPSSDLILWPATILVGLGVWIFASRALVFLEDLAFGSLSLLRRLLRPRLSAWLNDFQGEPAPVDRRAAAPRLVLSRLLDLSWAWVLLSLCGAIFLHDPMLSPVILAGLIVVGEVIRSERRQRRLACLNEDAGRLIVQFESRYPLLRSISRSLEKSLESLPERELRWTLRRCLQEIRVGREFREALDGMRKLPVPSLGQLTVVLIGAQEASPEVFAESLQMLRRDVEDRSLLHNQVRQSLTLLRGTLRILQIVLFLALLAASCLPAWRYYFLSSPVNWIKLLLALLVGVVSSLYVEAEIRFLEAG